MQVATQHTTGKRSFWEVAPELACVPMSIVNVYLSGPAQAGDLGWALIDTGLWTSGGSIRRAAAERFGPDARPAAIILTHGHFDHVGTVKALAEQWNAPVYAHELEMPYLNGESPYPPPDPAVGGGAMAFLSRFYPRGPIDLRPWLRVLPADGSVPGMPGWRWLHTPGHAPGHVALFRDSDRALIAGDAFVTTKQESAIAALLQPQQVRRPPAYFTPDWQAARRSVQELAALEPSVAATGHGVPMAGPRMRQQLHALAHNFDRVAIPHRGRYIRQPAITNEHGIVQLPPPVLDPNLLVMAGLGAAAVVGWSMLRTRWRGAAQRLSY